MHGGVAKDDLGAENVEAVRKGCENLARHIQNVKSFGVPPVVAINQFISDTPAEMEAIREATMELGTEAIVCSHWADGSAGTEALANRVIGLADSGASQFQPLYGDDIRLFQKIEVISKQLYRASEVTAPASVRNQLKKWEADGYGHFPICMAKTQYSFSTDPSLKNAPDNHVVNVREVRLSAGAEFIVAITGDIMTMPGLPRKPAAEAIRLDEEGLVQGLF